MCSRTPGRLSDCCVSCPACSGAPGRSSNCRVNCYACSGTPRILPGCDVFSGADTLETHSSRRHRSEGEWNSGLWAVWRMMCPGFTGCLRDSQKLLAFGGGCTYQLPCVQQNYWNAFKLVSSGDQTCWQEADFCIPADVAGWKVRFSTQWQTYFQGF